ncbi:MAG: hypothetical protein CVT88_02960 [Candidatus Altiarchaeales archaeon HGW-Altiarchaeales-1]|nr:MAG: hypothetical protein CVT88_02960 [Candidatus Altiarchaeales archaeon HGW-Altiarchaeales-1]
MNILLYLLGDNITLPKAEAKGLIESYLENKNFSEIYEKNRLYIFSCEKFPFERMSMAKVMCEFIAHGENLEDIAKKVASQISGSFRVTSYSTGNFKDATLERRFGEIIKKHNENITVKLENYENEVMCLYTENLYFAGINKNREKFLQRIPSNRPFTVPVTMHPKLARTLINLARVKEGARILDPFCGSGAILVEAGLMGMKIFGKDISEYMLHGCRKNLDFYGVQYGTENLKEGDALKIRKKDFFDAIVTDLPYGRSSFTTNRNLTQLYNKFMLTAYKLLKEGKFAVIVSKDGIDYDFYKFKFAEEHKVRVHGGLTRRICVLKKE